MNIVLVYKGRYHVRQALELEVLASILRQDGHGVSLVYDPDTFGITDNVFQLPWLARRLSDPQGTVRQIAALMPDAVIFSVLQTTYRWSLRVAEEVELLGACPVIFAGLHPSLAPERVMQDSCVDYAVQGEVERVISPLLSAIEHGENPANVGNLWYRKDGRPIYTFRAGLVDLDALPMPDKDLFRPHISHSYSYVAMVSRGCPFRCSFCEETCIGKLHGPKYFRRKKVETVIRELVEGKRKYGFKEVIFKDSYLTDNTQWLKSLMTQYRKEIGLPFKCFCTISGFEERTAQLLKEGGCYCVEFGLQTWNDDIRRNILHRSETGRDAIRVFNTCAEYELWYDVDHMFGVPGETEKDHKLGATRYSELRYLNRVKVHYLVCLPGADIVNHALKAGSVPPDVHDRLADGWESDFYDPRGGTADSKLVAGFATLYKVLPVIPRRGLRWLLKGRRTRLLRLLPRPFVALCQSLMALRSRDLRFVAYMRYYPVKILKSCLRQWWRSRLRAPSHHERRTSRDNANRRGFDHAV